MLFFCICIFYRSFFFCVCWDDYHKTTLLLFGCSAVRGARLCLALAFRAVLGPVRPLHVPERAQMVYSGGVGVPSDRPLPASVLLLHMRMRGPRLECPSFDRQQESALAVESGAHYAFTNGLPFWPRD